MACFSAQPSETLAEPATTLRTILGKVDGMLGNPAFNLVLRSLGPEEKEAGHFPLAHLNRPRESNKRAGFELGTCAYTSTRSRNRVRTP